MRDHTPSFTAAWVAACRGAADLLPKDARLIDDPFGLAFAGPLYEWVARAARVTPHATSRVLPFTGPLYQSMLWLQLRTARIDQHVHAFAARGGRQVVILGAGLDARAFRLRLGECRFFEVDHPATQAKKLAVAARRRGSAEMANPPTFLAWDFENGSLSDLPAALTRSGLSMGAPTLTIWEGVTMYLTEPTVEASVAAIRAYCPEGSELVLTYFDSTRINSPDPWTRLVKAVVAGAGEPFRFGWAPSELPSWMSQRGWTIALDESDIDLVDSMLTPDYRKFFRRRGGHVARALLDG